MILENTNSKFQSIVDKFGGDQKTELATALRSLCQRVRMDVQNAVSRTMSEAELEVRQLPLDED